MMEVTQREKELAEALSSAGPLQIAVLIPCHNEEVAIGKVISGFAQALPAAKIYVYDNNSTDRTIEVARAAGAFVVSERLQGKGNVVRRMFSDVHADIYVLVDGDDTYEASSAPAMIELLLSDGADMVTGTRVTEIAAAYRPGHRMGNVTLTGIVSLVFGSRCTDMLSGYRIFSRRFVKTFPALSSGFETETELTIHALELRMPLAEMETPYRDRAAGSTSKLSTYKDGLRILFTIIRLIKEERPLYVFAFIALVVFVAAMVLGIPLIIEFERIHLVPRLPTAVLSAALVMLSFLSLVCGLVMDSLALARKEAKRLAYLSIPPVRAPHLTRQP
jgi:glycosyltransferase involved in cell wall biosynthesis